MYLNKELKSFREAVSAIFDGATILVSGFGGTGGSPQNLIKALRDHGAKDLTIVSNTGGLASVIGFGSTKDERPVDIGILVENFQVKKLIASYPVSPSASKKIAFEKAYLEGKAELELVPQGNMVERIRAGGAGIPAFYTPTGVGTVLSQDKEVRKFNDREYILEHAIKADFALVKAYIADKIGNVIYKGTSQSFGRVMSTAAEKTYIEVDHIVDTGMIDPNIIHTPTIFVDGVILREK